MHGERIVAVVVAAGPVADGELADHLRVVFPAAVLPQRTERVPANPQDPHRQDTAADAAGAARDRRELAQPSTFSRYARRAWPVSSTGPYCRNPTSANSRQVDSISGLASDSSTSPPLSRATSTARRRHCSPTSPPLFSSGRADGEPANVAAARRRGQERRERERRIIADRYRRDGPAVAAQQLHLSALHAASRGAPVSGRDGRARGGGLVGVAR